MKVLNQLEYQLHNLHHTIDIDRYEDRLQDVLTVLSDIQEACESDPAMQIRRVDGTSLTYWS